MEPNQIIANRIADRMNRGFSDESAIVLSLMENPVTKEQAAAYATKVYGVEVRKSWTVRKIAQACAEAAAL